jgi:NAD-dependent dihydropyrimidine dehydrogenase PreA subunit
MTRAAPTPRRRPRPRPRPRPRQVYATLIDPERRALYDAVAGFAAEAVNPFLDASYPNDSVFVDEYTCIGCRNCTNVCPSSFAIEGGWP